MVREGGVAGVDAAGVENPGGALGKKAQDGEGHGDAMISETVHGGTGDGFAALDDHSIRPLFDGNTEFAEVGGDGGNAVGFFNPELGGIADFRNAFRKGKGNGEDGEFVNDVGDFVPADAGRFEVTAFFHDEGSGGFAAGGLDRLVNECAHAEENPNEAGAGGVEADVGQGDGTLREGGSGDQPEGSGGEIAGDIYVFGMETVLAEDGGLKSGFLDGAVKVLEHPLGVVSGRAGLDHGGLAFRLKSSEENAGFELGAGDWGLVGDGGEGGSMHGERRAEIGPFALDFGTHLSQGLDDPLHGTRRERGVAVEMGAERLPSDQSGQKSHGGPGVAAINGFAGREEGPVAAGDFQRGFIETLDLRPKSLHGAKGTEAVFTGQEIGHAGGAGGESGEHDGAVGDAFIAGDVEDGVDCFDRLDREFLHKKDYAGADRERRT